MVCGNIPSGTQPRPATCGRSALRGRRWRCGVRKHCVGGVAPTCDNAPRCCRSALRGRRWRCGVRKHSVGGVAPTCHHAVPRLAAKAGESLTVAPAQARASVGTGAPRRLRPAKLRAGASGDTVRRARFAGHGPQPADRRLSEKFTFRLTFVGYNQSDGRALRAPWVIPAVSPTACSRRWNDAISATAGLGQSVKE